MPIPLSREQILMYAEAYDRAWPEADEVVQRRLRTARHRGHLTVLDLETLVRWKSPRRLDLIRRNSAAQVRDLTRSAISAESDRGRIVALLGLDGVAFPMASAILHFVFPCRYPVLDVRAVRTAYGRDRNLHSFVLWDDYCELCRRKAATEGVSLRILDRALWMYDKDHGIARQRR